MSAAQFAELESLLPILVEKEKAGLIMPSSDKAEDLLKWYKAKGYWSEKQQKFVGRLIYRAKTKKSQKAEIKVTLGKDVDVDALVEQVIQKIGTKGVDTETVTTAVLSKMDAKLLANIEERVLKALDARVPNRTEIVVTSAETKKSTVVKGPQHAMFPRLLRAATTRLPGGYVPDIFLQGEASSGKTTGCKMLAEALKLKWHFNGAISFPHEMLGFIDGAGKYHRTPFREAYENGGVYTFDEVDRSDPVALLAVNPHLANGVATFPDKQIQRHKDCIIVCTANTWGLGADANYSGATKLDGAFLSRFPVRINWDIDAELERTVVGNDEWLSRVRKAREKARAVGLKVMIDTRAALAGAALIKSGFTADEAAEMTYLANVKPAQRQQIEGAY